MIMFLIAATTCVAVVGTVYLAVLSIMDRQHRLCSEKILPKAAATSGIEHWIQGQTIKVNSLKQGCRETLCMSHPLCTIAPVIGLYSIVSSL